MRPASMARSMRPMSPMKRAEMRPPGWVAAKMSKVVNRGAMARTAGCLAVMSQLAVMPTAEMPVAPTSPFDHGWATIQSTTSGPSDTKSLDINEPFTPNEMPEPRRSMSATA